MKKFNFRLQTVLKLRQQEEDQKQRAVGALNAKINDLQRQALEMAEDISREGEVLRPHIQGSVNVNRVGIYQGYVTYLRHSISSKIDEVGRVHQRLQEARRELAEAAKQTKILEKLREKQKSRYDRAVKKIEVNEMDEIGTKVQGRTRSTG